MLFWFCTGISIVPKMARVPPLDGTVPAASGTRLAHKHMTSRITEFGATARRAVSCGGKIVDRHRAQEPDAQPSLPPSGFMHRTFSHAEPQAPHPPTWGNHTYLARLLKGDMDKTRKRQTQKQIIAMYGEGNDEVMPRALQEHREHLVY